MHREEGESDVVEGKQPRCPKWLHVDSLPALFFAVVVVLLVFNVRPGADSTMYLRWSKAAVEGDIHAIYSRVESPLGLPLTQWSAGPGLAAAPLLGLLRTSPMEFLSRVAEWSWHLLCPPIADMHAALLTAAVFAVLLWLTLTRLFLVVTDGRMHWAVFGLACGFCGTHIGYYSLAYGAELLPLLPMALLVLELVRPMRSRLGSVLLAGSCAAILILIRPYLVLYATPTLVVTAIRTWWSAADGGRHFRLVLLAALPVLAIGQLAIVNYWMTGDWRKSTYAYGDGDFKSLDFAAPEIAAVLTHPLHGLLVYHPVYLIGFVAMIFLACRLPIRAEKVVWAAFILIVVAHLWIQSAWYQWWLATGVTFGMRGMAIAGIPCMVAILRLFMHLRTSGRGATPNAIITVLLVLASGWSWLLMRRGPTDYYTYAGLLASQGSALQELLASGGALLTGLALVFTALALGSLLPESTSDGAWSRLQKVATILLAALVLDFFLRGWFDHLVSPAYYGLVVLSIFLVALCYRLRVRFSWAAEPLPLKAAAASGLLLAMMLGWFIHLAIPTWRQLSEGVTPQKAFQWKEAFYVPEVQSGYRDYLKIPGFEEQKERLRRFIEPFGSLGIEANDERPGAGP